MQNSSASVSSIVGSLKLEGVKKVGSQIEEMLCTTPLRMLKVA